MPRFRGGNRQLIRGFKDYRTVMTKSIAMKTAIPSSATENSTKIETRPALCSNGMRYLWECGFGLRGVFETGFNRAYDEHYAI